MEIHFEMRRDYLYVQLTGTFDLDEAMLLYLEAQEEADLHAATKVLIDCLELKGVPTVVDRYRLGVFVAEQLHDSVSRSRAVAFVATEPLLDKRGFAELVATNRLAKIRGFDRMEDAKEWLAVDPKGENQEGA